MITEMPFRFWDKVLVGDGCWEWQGARPNGHYGLFSFGKKRIGAHRVAYSLWFGEIPDDLWVLHDCDNKGCVRPDHLWLGTPADNVADMVRKGRATRYRSASTHCAQGHPFDEVNTYWLKNGWRRCRVCQAEGNRRYLAAHPKPKKERPVRTHCKRGHELTEDNVYRKPSVPHIRFCKTCMYERNNRCRRLHGR